MPKRVAVIDLGSNSMRLAIFERTSRFGFYILAEHKLKIRLANGAYENGGMLQMSAMQNALEAFLEFKSLIKSYRANRVLCVGTSALRDAPNKNVFINMVKKAANISIRVIDGTSEANFGAIAALNLLANFTDATTLDIGGGSSELACIKNKKIVDKISLNIGTVRLKELFFDKRDLSGLEDFIKELIDKIPADFKNENLIAIGGSGRALSNAIMNLQEYPLKIVHNFIYDYNTYRNFMSQIIRSKAIDLNRFPIKKERYDTIREGVFIFRQIADFLGAKKIITSGAGVREGVFLSSILGRGTRLPENFNPSLKSLQDRFSVKNSNNIAKYAKNLFEILSPLHKLEEKYKYLLTNAAKICEIGLKVGFYAKHLHASYLALNALNYGFKHDEKVLIAAIIALHGKKELGVEFNDIKKLLPGEKIVIWLSFLLEFARILNENSDKIFALNYNNFNLKIVGAKENLNLKESIKKLPKPAIFAISLV